MEASERERSRIQWRFGVTFLAVAGLLFAAYAFPYQQHGVSEAWFKEYLAAYARLVGAVLGLFDSNVMVAGTLIRGRMTLEIVKACDAMEVNILFVSAVVAFPAPWLRKLAALGGGLIALLALNVLRIVSLYYIGVGSPDWFEPMHLDVWPLVLVVLTATLFLLLARWMQSHEAPDGG